MPRLPHDIVTSERKRDVANTAADLRAGQILLDPPRGFDEIQRIVVVFLNACSHCQNIRIKNNVGWIEPDTLRQNLIGASADLLLALEAVRLSLLVERHYDHRRAVAADQGGL